MGAPLTGGEDVGVFVGTTTLVGGGDVGVFVGDATLAGNGEQAARRTRINSIFIRTMSTSLTRSLNMGENEPKSAYFSGFLPYSGST